MVVHPAAWVLLGLLLGSMVSGAPVSVDSPESLLAAVGEATAGDEIVIASGRHRDWQVTIEGSFPSENPLVIRGAANGGTVFESQSSLRINGQGLVLRGLVFRGCTAEGSAGLVYFLGESAGCRLSECTFTDTQLGHGGTVVQFHDRASRNRVDHCTFQRTRYRCVRVAVGNSALEDGGPVENRIDHNLFEDVPRYGRNGAETIQIGSRAWPLADVMTRTLIENNVFRRCNGEAEIISDKTSGNIIRGNLFEECAGDLTIRHGHRSVVSGNRFVDCTGNGGIRVHGSGHTVTDNVFVRSHTAIFASAGTSDAKHPASYLPVTDCRISHNTIIDPKVAGLHFGAWKDKTWRNTRWATHYSASEVMVADTPPHGNVIEANLVIGNTGVLVTFESGDAGDLRGNLLWARDQAEVGEAGAAAILAEPRFQDPERGDYRLRPESPGSGSGTGEGAPGRVGATGLPPAAGPTP